MSPSQSFAEPRVVAEPSPSAEAEARHAVTLDTARAAVGPFLLAGTPGSPAASWYDAHLFSTERLGAVFGVDAAGELTTDGKLMAGFWERCKTAVKVLRPEIPLSAVDMERYAILTAHRFTGAARHGAPGMAVRRLERVLDPKMFRGADGRSLVSTWDTGVFSRPALMARFGAEDGRAVHHLWRRFLGIITAVRPELASTDRPA